MSFSTSRVTEAAVLADIAHEGQKRKITGGAYIMHPTIVALLLAEAGASEDVIIAGYLHDTLEDTDLPEAKIREKFGDNVLRLVVAVTERDKSLPWKERKAQALEHVPEMEHDELMLKSADVIANVSDTCHALVVHGESVWGHFNAPKEDQIIRYERLVAAILEAWPENPLGARLTEVLTQLKDLAENA